MLYNTNPDKRLYSLLSGFYYLCNRLWDFCKRENGCESWNGFVFGSTEQLQANQITMKKNWLLYYKLHRWPGLILSFFLLYFGITGIFLNHRETFSGVDVRRQALPKAYHYNNWNNAAIKGQLNLGGDSLLLYGSIGIWLSDTAFSRYEDFNRGLPQGSDPRRVFDMHRCDRGHLYAATLFGLYAYDREQQQWLPFDLEVDIKRFVGIETVGDTLYAINRSHLFRGLSAGPATQFRKMELQATPDYQQRVSLMKTIWQIHSGEIFGLPGQLFVDALGLVTIFLSLTGIVWFFFPDWIKRRRRAGKPRRKLILINTWSLRWHNKVGAWTFVLLAVLYFTGIFLRPPFLIAIARSEVPPLPYTHLDQPNPWYDKLRDLLYDAERDRMLVSTLDGMFWLDRQSKALHKYENQPPISVMGINVFETYDGGAYLIGSFSGLFLWHPAHPEIWNFAQGKVHVDHSGGRPVGDYKVTGALRDAAGRRYMVDYDQGVLPLWHEEGFPAMPENILESSGISLWNVSLEIHTGRFFSFLLSDFYILIVPLAGLAGVMVVISGYILYRRKYRKRKKATR